jgi:aminopeptidase
VTDPRVERLAALLLDHSLGLREGQVVRVDGEDCAAPLLLELYRAALRRGAHPYLNVELEGLAEILLEEGSDEQIEHIPDVAWLEVETVDALVTVWGNSNTKALSSAPAERVSRHVAMRRRLAQRRWERISAGRMTWVGTLFPTHAHAQDAELPLAEYERFVFRACHVEDPQEDAAAYWRSTSAVLRARAEALSEARELRVVGEDTDLRLGVAGRTWLAADGLHNMPDGEVYTSPLETATEGEIRFALPAIYEGREAEDVRLRFAAGEVVAAEAGRGEDYLRALLEVEGARVLGEVAFGLNYEIDRFTRNILFDEKIGGTMHFALGSSFPETGGRNTALVHWDMICDLREHGEVYADGELVWKAGRFVAEPEGPGG